MRKQFNGVFRYAAFFSALLSLSSQADFEGLTISAKGWEHRVGGLLQWDSYWAHDFLFERPGGTFPKGDDILRSAIRRSRLEFAGTPLPGWHYRLQWDFRNSAQAADSPGSAEPRLRDAWLRSGDLDGPLYVQVGQQREPLSLEYLTATANVVPTERSLNDNVFYPRRSQGISLGGYYSTWFIDHITWQAGVFNNGQYPRRDTGATPAYTGRLAFSWEPVRRNRPWADPGDYFHLGIYASHRDASNSFNFAENFTTNYHFVLGPDRPLLYLDENTILDDYRIDNQQWLGVEAAVIYGLWYGHVEYLEAYHESPSKQALEDYDPEVFFAEVGWLFTGETRGYDPVLARFSRVQPERASGAWMVFFRWTDADLEDVPIGTSVDLREIGVNWYPNEHLVFKLEWRHIKTASNRYPESCPSTATTTDDCDFDRTADLVTFRAQADF